MHAARAAAAALQHLDGVCHNTAALHLLLACLPATPALQAVRTRSNLQCLEKWYDQLSPSMVDRGDWGPGDDRRLLRSMYRRWVLGTDQVMGTLGM